MYVDCRAFFEGFEFVQFLTAEVLVQIPFIRVDCRACVLKGFEFAQILTAKY